MKKIFLIGIGHRARSGKDTVAKFINTYAKNTVICHFADALKSEVCNTDQKYPLIYKIKHPYYDSYIYKIHSHDDVYEQIEYGELPLLDKIFDDRHICEYWGSSIDDDKKDSQMLQFWGTDWRRNHFSDDYWVQKVEEHFIDIYEKDTSTDNLIFVLPDTRFINEVNWIRELPNRYPHLNINSTYIKTVRYNLNGTSFYSGDRDKNHISECQLESTPSDIIISAKSGDVDSLKRQTLKFLKDKHII